MNILISMTTAVLSAVGFGMYFRIKPDKLPFAAIGGLIAWGVKKFAGYMDLRIFFAAFAATSMIVVYSEIMARVLKAPANTVLIPSVVPLLPGSRLYYTMAALIEGDLKDAYTNGVLVLQNVLGIGVGILMAMYFYYKIISLKK